MDMELQYRLSMLDDMRLSRKDFVVVCSGVLEAKGIRKAADLDIMVTRQLFCELVIEYKEYVQRYTGCNCLKLTIGGFIEIFDDSLFVEQGIATEAEIFGTADSINGINYMALDLVRRTKEKLNRWKDRKDLPLIEDYMRHYEQNLTIEELFSQNPVAFN